MVTIHQKIGLAILGTSKTGELLDVKEIKQRVKEYFPGINNGSILPQDLCINKKNKDPNSGIHHVFKYISRNQYKVLPPQIIKSFYKKYGKQK